MEGSARIIFVATPLLIITTAVFIALLVLIFKALLKYVRSKEVRAEKSLTRKSLGEVLYAHRTACKMTQEFVAESLGVSRQAVSKWESGLSDPNTTNLIAVAKLFGVTPEELIKEAQGSNAPGSQ